MTTDPILTHPLYLAAKERYLDACRAFDEALLYDTPAGLDYLRSQVEDAQTDLSETYARLDH